MIVRNEAENLAACLNSIRSVVDEIIIVDTGSTDATATIAAHLGAKTFYFPWCDDFSAARNESLRQATGDYIVWLDADDRLDLSQAENLGRLKMELPSAKNHAFYLLVQSESGHAGNSLCRQMRVIPNIPAARFQNRVHEQVARPLLQAGVQPHHRDIIIRHLGYLSPAAMTKKALRNLRLLEQELCLDPNNLLLHLDMARTLAGLNQQTNAIPHLQRILDDPQIRSTQPSLFLETALLMGTCYNAMGQAGRAEKILSALFHLFPRERLISFHLGESLLLLGRHPEAVTVLLAGLDNALPIGASPVNPEWVQCHLFFFLGQAYQAQGEWESAKKCYRDCLAYPFEPGRTHASLGEVCFKNGDFTNAVIHLEKAIQAGQDSREVYLQLAASFQEMQCTAEAEKALALARERTPEYLAACEENLCRQTLAKKTDDVETLVRLGQLRLAQKDFNQALHFLEHARALQPASVAVRLALSNGYLRCRRFESLVQECTALLQGFHLPSQLALTSLNDLAGLYENIGDHLIITAEQTLAWEAFSLSLGVYPRASVLEKIIPLSAALSCMRACITILQETLLRYAEDPFVISLIREFANDLPLSIAGQSTSCE
jgi:tetratricopeptide (TPR) repeat protein